MMAFVTCFRDGMVTLRKNRRLRGFTEAIYEFGYQGIRKGDLVIHAMDAFAGAVGCLTATARARRFTRSVSRNRASTRITTLSSFVRWRGHNGFLHFLAAFGNARPISVMKLLADNTCLSPHPLSRRRLCAFWTGAAGAGDPGQAQGDRAAPQQKQAIIHHAVTRGLDPPCRSMTRAFPGSGRFRRIGRCGH